MASTNITVLHFHLGEWITVADARAEYGPHGEKFNHSRFVLTHGTEVADALGEAIRGLGRVLSTGCVGVELELEGSRWRLESQPQVWS